MFDSFAGPGLSAFLVGAAIKLMDDRLDAPTDHAARSFNWSLHLGRADLPYALLLLALAVSVNRNVAVCLFLAAYATGMARVPGTRSPLHVPFWAESLAVLVIGVLLAGWKLQLGAVCVAASIQIVDDVRDHDQQWGPVKRAYETTERLMAAGCLVLGALLTMPFAVVGAYVVYVLNELVAANYAGLQEDDDDDFGGRT